MSVPVVFDGYGAGQTSVTDVFSTLPVSTILDFQSRILEPMVAAETSGNGKFLAVVIVGHSDRQDNVAQFPTGEARRASELQASADRAENARSWLLSQFQAGVQIAGGTVPADWDSAINVSVARFPAGAAVLEVLVPTSESDRKRNRRVEFYVATFPRF